MTDVAAIRARAAAQLAEAGVVLAPGEQIEVTDFGLGEFDRYGLVLLTYVNTERYCAKELLLLPGQECPEHRHPPVAGEPGKQETFRCRRGEVTLHVAERPGADAEATTALVLRPGDQHTIPPDTWHRFRAGPEGALVSEFSSTSRDDADLWRDERIDRTPAA